MCSTLQTACLSFAQPSVSAVYGTGTNLFVEEYSVSQSGELLPIRWMAPEMLHSQDEGSSYADVWYVYLRVL